MTENGGEEPKDPSIHWFERKPDPCFLKEVDADRNAKLPRHNSPFAVSAAQDDGNAEFELVSEKECGKMNDRKRKRVILPVDKGKGKMVVLDDDDNSDYESGGYYRDGDHSDFSDEPLREVDADNILPLTMRRRPQPSPGGCLANHQYGDGEEEEDMEEDDEDYMEIGWKS